MRSNLHLSSNTIKKVDQVVPKIDYVIVPNLDILVHIMIRDFKAPQTLQIYPSSYFVDIECHFIGGTMVDFVVISSCILISANCRNVITRYRDIIPTKEDRKQQVLGLHLDKSSTQNDSWDIGNVWGGLDS